MSEFAKFFIASGANDYHPKILNYKTIVVIAIGAVFLRLFLATLPTTATAVESQTLMVLVNKEREQRNLTVLVTNTALLNAASRKSQDMIDRDYFAHQTPDGNYIWPLIINAGYGPYRILGENLAIDFATSEGMVKAWIDSPTHRDNLLHPDFIHQGLSVKFGDWSGRYTNLTTSLFGAPISAQSPAVAQRQEEPPPANPKPEPETTPQTQPEATDTSTEPEPEEPEPTVDQTTETQPSPADTGLTTPQIIRIVFLVFGLGFLAVLTVDSVIIYRHEAKVHRGHPSYHLFIFFLLILIFALVWFWR